MSRAFPILATLAIAAFTAQPVSAGTYYARTDATATVWDQPSDSMIQPWSGYAMNGGSIGSGTTSNTLATSSNNGGTFEGKTLSAFAEADLSKGTLRAQSYAANAKSTSSIYGTAYGSAEFGDSFSFQSTNGGAFNWNPDTTVTFKIRVHGSSSNSTNEPQNDWNFGLQIYSSGAFAGPAGAIDAQALAAGAWNSSRTTSSSVVSTYVPDWLPLPIAMMYSGTSLEDGYELTATFAPGGAFDWRMSLDASGNVSDQLGIASSDLSHTATVSFTGPAGAVVTSGSGVFPLASVVPEPETYAMLLAGLGMLGFMGKKRRRAG